MVTATGWRRCARPLARRLAVAGLALLAVPCGCDADAGGRAGAQPATPQSPEPAASRPAEQPRPGQGMVHGLLVDDLGDPVSGARVFLQPPRRQLQVHAADDAQAQITHTDLRGEFRLHAPPSPDLVLVVHHPYFQPLLRRRLVVTAGQRTDLGQVELRPAPGVVVVVRDRESQQLLADATVRLSPALTDAMLPDPVVAAYRREARTSRTGRAVFYGVAEGLYNLRVDAPGRASTELTLDHPAAVVQAIRVPVELARGRILRGLVLVAGGKPATEVDVDLTPLGVGPSFRTRTDGRGEFAFTGLQNQAYRLELRSAVHGRLVRDPVRPGSTPLTLRLPAGRSLAGRILHRTTRQPVAGARITVRSESGWPTLRAGALEPTAVRTDGSGQFRIDGLPKGILYLIVSSKGLSSLAHGPVVAGSKSLTLLMEPGFRVTGKVLDPAGRPARDARVQVIRQSDPEFMPKTSLPTSTTSSSGRFDLAGVPPGPFRLRIHKAGFAPYLGPVKVARAGATEDAGEHLLVHGGRILGEARDAADQPAAGATVCLEPLSGPATCGAKAICDHQGRFAVGPVAPGRYVMFYYSPGQETPAEAAATRQATLVEIQARDRQDLTQNLHHKRR